MSNIERFAARIEGQLRAAQERRDQTQTQREGYMEQLELRKQQFHRIAAELMTNAIRPPVDTLVRFFDNAEVAESDDLPRYECHFRRSDRFPATVVLKFAVLHDEPLEQIQVTFDAQVLPVFMEYERLDELSFPLEDWNATHVANWIEKKLALFLESYLTIETSDQYQRANQVVDPVCGMRINRSEAVTEEHRGQVYYFCADRCRRRFREEPHRFRERPVEDQHRSHQAEAKIEEAKKNIERDREQLDRFEESVNHISGKSKS